MGRRQAQTCCDVPKQGHGADALTHSIIWAHLTHFTLTLLKLSCCAFIAYIRFSPWGPASDNRRVHSRSHWIHSIEHSLMSLLDVRTVHGTD